MSSGNLSSVSLVNCFQSLYNSRSEGSDFTIVCQDGSEIPVHSFVLSAR